MRSGQEDGGGDARNKMVFWLGIAWMQFWLSVSIILWFWLETG